MAKVAIARNFERNLEAIEKFLAEIEATPRVFDDLIIAIASRLIPLLEAHPHAGRDWLLNPPPAESGRALQQLIIKRLQGRRELREFVFDHYLVLYVLDGDTVTLLAIRHHRQMGFDVD